MIKAAINEYWYCEWIRECQEKPTRKYLAIPKNPIGNPHNIWKCAKNNIQDIKKAELKCKLVTGKYMLQSIRSKFSKAAMTPFCQLCTKAVEDIRHFLLDCEKLNDVRQKHYDSLVDYLRSLLGGDITVQLEKEQFLNILLDCSNVPQLFAIKTEDKLKLERKTQNFCYYLHMKRATMLMSRQ